MRVNAALSTSKVFNQCDSANGHEITKDHKERKPKGEMLPPVCETQDNDGGKEQGLVREGIENLPETTLLIEAAGDIAVHCVTDRRQSEDGHSPPAQGLIGCTRCDTLAVVDGEPDEDRDQEDPE